MEKTRRSLEARLEKLNNKERKDNVVTFEELGVDRLFVDESHSFNKRKLQEYFPTFYTRAQTERARVERALFLRLYLDKWHPSIYNHIWVSNA